MKRDYSHWKGRRFYPANLLDSRESEPETPRLEMDDRRNGARFGVHSCARFVSMKTAIYIHPRRVGEYPFLRR